MDGACDVLGECSMTTSVHCLENPGCVATPQRADDEEVLTTTRGKNEAEWNILSKKIVASFAESSVVSPDHPCAACVRECQWARLAKELRGKGRWVDGCYTRTTLLHTDSFVALLLCWPPGVCSPVHAHSDAETKIKSSCFMLVLEGALHETTFAPSQIVGPDAVSAVGGESRVLEAGATAYMDDNVGVHKVGNASTSTRAVSLHIYAPGWQTVQLYDEVAPADEVDAGGASLLLDGWGDF